MACALHALKWIAPSIAAVILVAVMALASCGKPIGLPYYVWSGIIGSLLGIASIAWMATDTREVVRKAIIAAWLVLPAIWFFAEYHCLRNRLPQAELQQLKDSQELASKIWAGVGAALAAMYIRG